MTVMDPGDDPPLLGSSARQARGPSSQGDPEPAASTTGPTSASASASASSPSLSQAQVEAFSDFYRAHVERVVTFLRFQGATWTEVAEAAQEAMTKAYQRWGTLTHPEAWVRTVATREFIRRRVDLREDPTDQLPEPVTALLRDPVAAAADDTEEERQVQRLLEQLPPRQRQVLAWTYDGYAPTQIAQQLTTTENPVSADAVRASLRLARRALSQHLGPTGGQP